MAEQQPTTEQRLKALETKYEDLERRFDAKEAEQQLLDSAFLAKLDEVIAGQGRQQRENLAIYRETMVELRTHAVRLGAIEGNLAALPEILKDHKAGIERNDKAIQAVDQKVDQVLSLLLGNQRRDD